MARRHKFTLTLLISLACLLTWMVWLPREPIHQGKPLSLWLAQYEQNLLSRQDPDKEFKRNEAESALRAIGTNALPHLLAMAGAKDSRFKTSLLSLLRKQSLIPISWQTADQRRAQSSFGFGALGTLAAPAVPDLVKLLQDEDPGVRASAANRLAAIGPQAEEAIPALLPLLDEMNNGTCILGAMSALGSIHQRPQKVIPALLEFLNGSRVDWNYAAPAMQAIGGYGAEARHMTSVLEPYLTNKDLSIQNAALNALNRIDPEVSKEALRKAWKTP